MAQSAASRLNTPNAPITGWGENPAKIEAVIRDDAEVLAMWREAMKQKQGQRTDIVDIVNEVKPSKGNSRAYTVSRLQREAPDLFAKVAAGEISANAAAIKVQKWTLKLVST